MLKLNKDRKVRYNYLQLAGTHKALRSLQDQRIQEVKETDQDYKDYKGRETQLKAIYILGDIIEKFITEFHKGETQGHNRATALVLRLQEEYIIRNIQNLARKITREYLDYQRNKSNKHKPYRKLQPIKTPSRPQEVISQDFIIKLLKSKDPVIR